jgi:hypothetical protein
VVNVIGQNINAPAFLQSIYACQIDENALPIDPIITVMAEDRDSGRNGFVIYSIDPALPFRINATTGAIFLLHPLDYESTNEYRFEVKAKDHGKFIQHTTTALVTVSIRNLNDNRPIIRNQDLDFYIRSSIGVGELVYAIDAYDADSDSKLKFKLSGEDADKFTIDQLGLIHSTISLNNSKYSILATVSDEGGLNSSVALSFYAAVSNKFVVPKVG